MTSRAELIAAAKKQHDAKTGTSQLAASQPDPQVSASPPSTTSSSAPDLGAVFDQAPAADTAPVQAQPAPPAGGQTDAEKAQAVADKAEADALKKQSETLDKLAQARAFYEAKGQETYLPLIDKAVDEVNNREYATSQVVLPQWRKDAGLDSVSNGWESLLTTTFGNASAGNTGRQIVDNTVTAGRGLIEVTKDWLKGANKDLEENHPLLRQIGGGGIAAFAGMAFLGPLIDKSIGKTPVIGGILAMLTKIVGFIGIAFVGMNFLKGPTQGSGSHLPAASSPGFTGSDQSRIPAPTASNDNHMQPSENANDNEAPQKTDHGGQIQTGASPSPMYDTSGRLIGHAVQGGGMHLAALEGQQVECVPHPQTQDRAPDLQYLDTSGKPNTPMPPQHRYG